MNCVETRTKWRKSTGIGKSLRNGDNRNSDDSPQYFGSIVKGVRKEDSDEVFQI